MGLIGTYISLENHKHSWYNDLHQLWCKRAKGLVLKKQRISCAQPSSKCFRQDLDFCIWCLTFQTVDLLSNSSFY